MKKKTKKKPRSKDQQIRILTKEFKAAIILNVERDLQINDKINSIINLKRKINNLEKILENFDHYRRASGGLNNINEMTGSLRSRVVGEDPHRMDDQGKPIQIRRIGKDAAFDILVGYVCGVYDSQCAHRNVERVC